MRRVLVYTPDLLFFSQVQGTAKACGWSAVHFRTPEELPPEDVSGDALVVDATRNLAEAWKVLEAAKKARPGLVLVCHQHLHPEVAEEATRRGATEAVRRGALLARLATRLGAEGAAKAPFVGPPPDAGRSTVR